MDQKIIAEFTARLRRLAATQSFSPSAHNAAAVVIDGLMVMLAEVQANLDYMYEVEAGESL